MIQKGQASSGEPIKADVVVIGSGLAGLTGAVGLSEAGLRVLVIEQDRILGGRARSWLDDATGDPVPIGPHIFLTEYHNLLKLLDLLGASQTIVWDKDQFITMVEGQHRILMKMSWLPAPFHFVPSLIRDPTLSNLDWMSNIPVTLLALSLNEADILRLDAVAAPSLLRKLGVSERYLERFWAFTSNAITNVPLELCSAGAILRFYRRLIGQRGFAIGLPDRGLGDVFAPKSRRLIEQSGGEVMLGQGVRRFLGTPDRVTGVELEGGRRIEGRHCIAAVPPDCLLQLTRDWTGIQDYFSGLHRFVPCAYRSVFIWFDRKLTDQRFWARHYRRDDLNTDFYDLSNIYDGWEDRPSLIASNIIFAQRLPELSDEKLLARTIRELSELVPSAADARVLHFLVNRIPMAIPCPFVGSERLRLNVATPVRGLILAGDWLRTGLPPCMESAALSGWLAAEQVLFELGHPRSLAQPHPENDWFARALGWSTRLLRPGWPRLGVLESPSDRNADRPR